MKINKKTFFKIHSWIGIKLSILFFIVCFSGTLATLSHEMDWLFIPSIRATPQKELASRNLIVSNLKKAYPNGNIGYWKKHYEPYLCDIIYVRGAKKKVVYVFANPYTGKIQGSATFTFQRFFRDLHYFLFIPFQVGNFMVLTFGFLLFISLITALLFFKKWWRKLFILQTRKGVLVFFRSFHRLIGLWSIPFTLLFSITGIWYFIERANIAGIGREVNPRPPKITTFTAKTDSTINLSYTIDYDKIIKISQQEIPTLETESIAIIPSATHKNTIDVRGRSDVPLVRQRANRVFINPHTYEVVKVQNAKNISTTMWLNDIADPLHFGYWGGLVTKIIWFIMGLGISSLILSGIWITLKRKAINKRKRNTKTLSVWRYINWSIYGVMLSFMYYKLIITYRASIIAVMIISTGWLIFIGLGYYIFIYRLNKVICKT
jgi:uncharacterized iron-regulated membrane protein